MAPLSRRGFVTATGGAIAGLAAAPTIAAVLSGSNSANAATLDTYAQHFMDLYNLIKTKGYFHPTYGVPYHSVETLMVEAPDHGHETTSEAFSYWIWLEATYGRVTGDWGPFNSAWQKLETTIIPSSTDQPSNSSYNASSPATYAPEFPSVSSYPSPLDKNAPVGADPIAGELQSAYGTADIYAMHWLMDVDNVYGYGNQTGSGAEKGPTGVTGPCFINSYQRGSQESVWETVPQPTTDLMTYGGPNGYLDLFVKDSSYAKQWKYTDAPDADARAVQAAYWAYRWASAQGNASAVTATAAKAAKLGDYLRYAMFDKYFKKIGNCVGAETCPAGSGRNSQHYLLGWYFAWGGAEPGGGWAWRIGDGVAHHGYQNPVAAWALSTVAAFAPKSSTGKSDWATSLTRQKEFLQWLQSPAGAIAGGASNSWDGQYGTPPAGGTFYGMAYDWEPVYHDPPSNNWFGMQTWGMERWAEYYYLTNDATIKPILDKWVNWVTPNVKVNSDGTFSIPSTLTWGSGSPDTWNPSSPGANSGLTVSITESGSDAGVAGSLAKALSYYAKATSNTTVQNLAKSLLDALWTHNDGIGIGIPESRKDYSRFNDPVYIPSGWTGKMPNGDPINSSSTFSSIRSFYKNDPNWSKLQAALSAGTAPTFTYHRFWAQVDIATAFAVYSELFLGGTTVSPSAGNTASATASATASVSPSASRTSTSPSPSATSGGGTGSVTATYSVASDWGSGFVGNVTVKNNGTSAISHWTVTWNWAGNQQITNSWSATVNQSGKAVSATNANWNGSLAPGASASFGFQGTYSGSNTAPTLSASGG